MPHTQVLIPINLLRTEYRVGNQQWVSWLFYVFGYCEYEFEA